MSMPGLVALTAPQNPARGRERDCLIAYLNLSGNSTFLTSEYTQIAMDAAAAYFQTPGASTTALRVAIERTNNILLERNLKTSKIGQFAMGWLTMAAVRERYCTIAISGPMYVHTFSPDETQHIHDALAAGKGLGTNPSIEIHYAQTTLVPRERLLLYGRAPEDWNTLLENGMPNSMESMREILMASTNADLNAVLVEVTEGSGVLNFAGKITEVKAEERENASMEVHRKATSNGNIAETANAKDSTGRQVPTKPARMPVVAPEKRTGENKPERLEGETPRMTRREFPASIPRKQPPQSQNAPLNKGSSSSNAQLVAENTISTQSEPEAGASSLRAVPPRKRRERTHWTQQTAKSLAGGIQSARRANEGIFHKIRSFLPRMLPNSNSNEPFSLSTGNMMFLAVLIPLMVVTIFSVVYMRYGRSQQYDTYLSQAIELQTEAKSLSNPVEQRQAWENVLLRVEAAESYRITDETAALRADAESSLDQLLGITRLAFSPAFSKNPGLEISRMAASESELYLLNAETGEALRAQAAVNGGGFQIDPNFSCKPGTYGDYNVGPLVDILTLPALNSINATLLGVDAAGNLLYCEPGQVAQAIPLPPPDTNWGRVTSFTFSDGNLYVLDAPARAVWVYIGKDGTFVDRPYFFFGGQTPEKQDVIDLIISGDDLYMLHADGHLSTCSYSRIDTKPTRCQDPATLTNPFAAYQGDELFTNAHFTQILFTALPDQSILLLASDTQNVLRFAPRTLELQNQFRPMTGNANRVPAGTAGAVAVGPNHILYMAVNGQVYFASDMP